MFQIDLQSRKAIYEQIVDNFKRLITTKALAANERVPSIRDMANELSVNPNTIQKAYRELETLGYFYTVLGQGNFISPPKDETDSKLVQGKLGIMREIVRELLFHGVQMNVLIALIEKEAGYVDKN